MTLSRLLSLAVTACLVAGPAARVRAGVADTPLPTFADGRPAKFAVFLPMVVSDNNLRTYVVCTNLGTTPVDVGLEVFDSGGTRGNTIAAGNGALLNVPADATVTFSTGTTVVLHEEVVVALELPVTVLGQGSGRVVSTALQVACTAYAVDRLHAIRDPVRPAERPPARSHRRLLHHHDHLDLHVDVEQQLHDEHEQLDDLDDFHQQQLHDEHEHLDHHEHERAALR